ncbi:hypothetical protein [Mesobacillus thioparans]|uniref:hypothetical protein n=1 Tax=Mesobacillus thioparans TaxID=370439 RepID=UPI0039EFEE57
MDITVNEQAQQFYLALEKWAPVVGHEIKVGEYRFCAIPIANRINISEVTTGARLFNVPVDLTIHLITETKEDTIKFLYAVGESIKRVIDKQVNFDEMLSKMKKTSIARLGDMPPIEDVDIESIFEKQKEKELKDVHVFQLCECDAVAAYTQEEARSWYKELTGLSDEDLYKYEDVEIVSPDYKVRKGEEESELITVGEIVRTYWEGKPFIAISTGGY